MRLQTILLILVCYSCQSAQKELHQEKVKAPSGKDELLIGKIIWDSAYTEDHWTYGILKDTVNLEDLYWGPLDSIVTKGNTRTIYNSRMDTVLIETGIFTYLRHDYRVSSSIPDSVYYPIKKAEYYSEMGDLKKAQELHEVVLDYYRKHWSRSTIGYRWTDLNAVYSHKVNTSILISYSLEQLGYLQESIEVLKPYLANIETSSAKIQYRFIEQCIKQYGKDGVKNEVEQCRQSFQYSAETNSWTVTLYGTQVEILNHWPRNKMTSSEMDSIVQEMDFYTLLN